MASIQKRGKKYAVVYTYEDSAQIKRQKWETFSTKKEALARKAQVENEVNNGTFIPPSSVTVAEFLKDFVELYGSKRWGLSAYTGNVGLIDNYINPILGEYNVQDVSRRVVDGFILKLQKTPPVSTPYRKARTETLPPCTIEKICKVMHCAFRQEKGSGYLDGGRDSTSAEQLLRRKAVHCYQFSFCLLSATWRNYWVDLGLCPYF